MGSNTTETFLNKQVDLARHTVIMVVSVCRTLQVGACRGDYWDVVLPKMTAF